MGASIITAYMLPYKLEYDCPYCGAHISEDWNPFAMKHEINLHDRTTWPTTISCRNCHHPVDTNYDYCMP